MPSSPIIPKRERSPTPPLTRTPRTSGVKLVAPLPISCKKSSPNYQQARKEWVREEVKVLKALGLTITKMLIRDDGLSLEWESPVPVWPDTLKPANLPSTSSSPPSPVRIEEDVNIQEQAEPEPSHMNQEGDEFDKEANELEDLAIEFLKRLVQAFDTDRATLANAYANNALFSYSVHECSSIPRNSVAAAFTSPNAEAYRFAPRKGARNLLQAKTSGNLHSGRSEIISALLSLGPHKFCARLPTDLSFNVLALQPSRTPVSKPLVFLSSHGDLTEERSGSEIKLSFDQCFLLRRPEVSGPNSDGSSESEPWPLVAINHQLTVRDLSFRPSSTAI